MSWDMIKSIQDKADLRLIYPFGLDLRIGDVISVGKDGGFTLEGNCKALLGVPAGKIRHGEKGIDLVSQSSKDTKLRFLAKGKASTLFPDLPAASARFDLTFGSAQAWLMAFTGRALSSLSGINRLRQPILDAYNAGVWKPDWALVNGIAKVNRMTLIVSLSRNTSVALSIKGRFDPAAALEVKLTAGVSLAALNHRVEKHFISRPMPAFCTALRVQDGRWSSPKVGSLARKAIAEDVNEVSDEDFWEDVDAIGR